MFNAIVIMLFAYHGAMVNITLGQNNTQFPNQLACAADLSKDIGKFGAVIAANNPQFDVKIKGYCVPAAKTEAFKQVWGKLSQGTPVDLKPWVRYEVKSPSKGE